MARTTKRNGTLMVFVMLLIALPAVVGEMQAAPTPLSAPPSLDSLLESIRRATPPTARILAAGTPPSLVFYRATALLYPRRVYSAFPTDYAHGWTAPPTSWGDLKERARRDGAGYVLAWLLSPRVQFPRTALVRADGGMLVAVAP